MKKFILILAFINTSKLFSQINIYKPFPEVNGQWEVKKTIPQDPNPNTAFSWKKYVITGDTMIGAYSYKNVSCASYTGSPAWNGTEYVIPYGPDSFSFGFRNDIPSKKVYIVYQLSGGGTSSDTIWYDFNLTIGDTLKDTYSFTNPIGSSNNPRRIVQSIDSVLICGQYYKKFHFSCSSNPFDTDLIEGCGFSERFTQTNFIDCPFEPYYLYETTFSTCISNSIGENDKKLASINLYPNPTVNKLSVTVNNSQLIELRIYDAKGAEVLKSKYPEISTSELSKGIYLIKIKTTKGEFSKKFIKD